MKIIIECNLKTIEEMEGTGLGIWDTWIIKVETSQKVDKGILANLLIHISNEILWK